MSKKGEYLRALVTERLTAAAEEIFALFERTIVEYEEELFRTKEESQRRQQLLDSVLLSPQDNTTADVPPQTPQGETGPSQITDSSQQTSEGEFRWAAVKTESDEQTDNSEDWEAPCSSSAPLTKPKIKDPDRADTSEMKTEAAGDDVGEILTPHQSTHNDSGEILTPHQCCFCDKTFQRPQELKKHMEIHALEIHMENLSRIKQSGEVLKQCITYPPTPGPRRTRSGSAHGPPFSCPFCKRCFARKFDLRSHILIHTGEKPFACSQCNMRFNRKSNLYRHFRNHAKKT